MIYWMQEIKMKKLLIKEIMDYIKDNNVKGFFTIESLVAELGDYSIRELRVHLDLIKIK